MALYSVVVRPKDAKEIDGLSESQREREKQRGTHVKPFRLSTDPVSRAVGFFRHELTERRDAVIAGENEEQLRIRVQRMMEARKALLNHDFKSAATETHADHGVES